MHMLHQRSSDLVEFSTGSLDSVQKTSLGVRFGVSRMTVEVRGSVCSEDDIIDTMRGGGADDQVRCS
jgi:hypothetical protein